MILALLACQSPAPVSGESGISLGLFASDPLYDYGSLVDEIREVGAPEMMVVVPWSLQDVDDASLVSSVPRPQVRLALAQARAAGTSISVMPIVQLGPSTGAWRGQLAPIDLGRFWSNYDTLLLQLAHDAEAVGASRLIIGSELASLESDPSWRSRIEVVRPVFTGTLTYSANWDRFAEVPFWSELDEVGVSAYWSRRDWHEGIESAQEFAASQGKPLLVTEVGFAPLASASTRPWDHATPAPFDLELQADLLRFTTGDLQRRGAPFFIWNWFGHGGPEEVSFTPRGRPAEEVVRCAFDATRRGCEP